MSAADQQRISFLTCSVVFSTLAELTLEVADKTKMPPAMLNAILDGYEQLGHAFEHDDPSNLGEYELTIFAAIRDRIADP